MVTPDAPAVEAVGLQRAFGRDLAVKGLTLSVRRGEVFGLLGLNGAGKTTSIRMLTTLLSPTGGTARVHGHDVVAHPVALRRVIGLVGEDSGRSRLDWRISDYLTYFGALHGLPTGDVRASALPLLRALLPDKDPGTRLHTLSSGMRKKVEIVRALLPRPRVLFLDEPTKDLDIPSKQTMWEFLRRETGQRWLTIVLTSHDAIEIEQMCDRVCVLRRGEVAFEGPATALGRGIEMQREIARLLTGVPGDATLPMRG